MQDTIERGASFIEQIFEKYKYIEELGRDLDDDRSREFDPPDMPDESGFFRERKMETDRRHQRFIVYEQTHILNLLNSLTHYKNHGITQNQCQILKIIFDQTMDTQDVLRKQRFFLRVKSINDEKMRIYNAPGPDNRVQPESYIEDYVFYMADSSKIKFLIIQFYLYANLCFDRNYECIDMIKNVVQYKSLKNQIDQTWRQIQEQIRPVEDSQKGKDFKEKQIKMYQELKAALTYLLNAIYIDVKPNIYQKMPFLLYQIFYQNVKVELQNKMKNQGPQLRLDNHAHALGGENQPANGLAYQPAY